MAYLLASGLLEWRKESSQAVVLQQTVDKLVLGDSAVMRAVQILNTLISKLLWVVLTIGAQQVEHTGDDHS